MARWIALLALLAAPALAQDRVKVPGAELQEWLSRYWVLAGTNDGNGCAFFVVSHSADNREQHYHCPNSGAGTGKGTARVDGDRLCSRWSYSNMVESCNEIYRVGENRYETGGAIRFYNLR